MGLAIGVIVAFIGMGLLLGPFIIDISQSKKETNTDRKRALEASAALIAIGTLFMIGGILIVAFSSGSKIVSSGLEGYTGEKPKSNVAALLKIKRESGEKRRIFQERLGLERKRLAEERLAQERQAEEHFGLGRGRLEAEFHPREEA